MLVYLESAPSLVQLFVPVGSLLLSDLLVALRDRAVAPLLLGPDLYISWPMLADPIVGVELTISVSKSSRACWKFSMMSGMVTRSLASAPANVPPASLSAPRRALPISISYQFVSIASLGNDI